MIRSLSGDNFTDGIGTVSFPMTRMISLVQQTIFSPATGLAWQECGRLTGCITTSTLLPETGKVLSLSTVFAVVKDLMGQDIGGVELAIVQKSFPDDLKELMVSPYFSEQNEQVRLTVRVRETSKDLRRDEFLRSVRERP